MTILKRKVLTRNFLRAVPKWRSIVSAAPDACEPFVIGSESDMYHSSGYLRLGTDAEIAAFATAHKSVAYITLDRNGTTFSAPVDGDYFILNDGTNPPVIFEFDDDASVVTTLTHRGITLNPSSAALLANTIATINAAPILQITASAAPGFPASLFSVLLENDNIGQVGNTEIITMPAPLFPPVPSLHSADWGVIEPQYGFDRPGFFGGTDGPPDAFNGWLDILETSVGAITTLAPLVNLKYVTSTYEPSYFGTGVQISSNTDLTTLAGLEGLKYVNAINVSSMPLLTDITALYGLGTITSGLAINYPGVVDLSNGFPCLTYAGSIAIYGLPTGSDITGIFPSLENVGAPIIPVYTPGEELNPYIGDVLLTTDAEIATFAAGNYDAIHGNLEITDGLTGDINSLIGLEKLNYVTGDVSIYENSALLSFAGMWALVRVDGSFYIGDNTAFNSVQGTMWLTHVGGDFEIYGAWGGITLSVNDCWPVLIHIGGDLNIHDTTGINNLGGFARLTEVDRILVESNADIVAITDFCKSLIAIPNDAEQGTTLSIKNNTSWSNGDHIFDRLVSLGNGAESFRLEGNTALTQITNSWMALTSFNGNFTIKDNTALTSLFQVFLSLVIAGAGSGVLFTLEGSPSLNQSYFINWAFANLQHARNFRFKNMGFTNFNNAFPALTTANSILIDSNASLISVAGLKRLVGNLVSPGPVTITNNPSLPTAAQAASLISNLVGEGYVGSSTNTGNGPG